MKNSRYYPYRYCLLLIHILKEDGRLKCKISVLVFFFLFLLVPSNVKAANWQWSEVDDKLQYIDQDTGNYISNTFKTIKGYTYFFDKNGYVHTGWLKYGKNYYFFNASGAMVKSKWIGKYYFQKNGTMAVNKWVNGKYVGKNGAWIPQYIKKKTAKFIRTAKGTKYRNYNGSYSKKTWQCIKGKWYYFYSTGYMAVKTRLGKYYVGNNGQMYVNKSVRIGNYRYYYGRDGKQYKRVKSAG